MLETNEKMAGDSPEPPTKKQATTDLREENGSSTKKSVVMVTGGSGLVGAAIKDYVESGNKKENEEWIFLSSKDGDLRDRKETDAIFAKYKPTHVIHLAAKVGGLFANMSQKVRFPDLNIPTILFHVFAVILLIFGNTLLKRQFDEFARY